MAHSDERNLGRKTAQDANLWESATPCAQALT